MLRRNTIKDIAAELGISANTVSKALNGKPKVSDEMRKLIIKTAGSMGYIPNRSAKAMAGKRIKIAVVYPRNPREFTSYMEDGFEEARRSLSDYKVTLELYTYDRLSNAEEAEKTLRHAVESGVDGLICHLGFSSYIYEDTLQSIIDKGIPVLILVAGMDYPGTIGIVQLNSIAAGALAAEFLGLTAKENRTAAIIVGNKSFFTHRQCIEGFSKSAAAHNMTVVGEYEAMEDKDLAYYLTGRIMKEYPGLGGIYISSYNSVGVCQWFEDNPEVKKPVIIGQDLYPAVIEKLKNKSLDAVIFQNQARSARKSVQIMFDYITGMRSAGECTELVMPQLILGSHLEYYGDFYNNKGKE